MADCSTARRQAIHDGIGGRANELGFKRKSERLYVREDDSFRLWIRFSFIGQDCFRDYAGVVAKDLEAKFAGFDTKIYQYGFNQSSQSHVYYSAIQQWKYESIQSQEDFGCSLGPFRYFLPWERFWRHRDPFSRSKVVSNDAWRPTSDPRGCASQSLEKWQATVEPWLERMRNPVEFAKWYSGSEWSNVQAAARAAAWARAGRLDLAKAILQAEYDIRLVSHDAIMRIIMRQEKIQKRYGSEEKIRNAAKEKLALNQKHSEYSFAFAAYLGIILESSDR